jgi:hypothetical protein
MHGACHDCPTIRTGVISFLFYEYFRVDADQGLRANHQTGWTALITHILETLADRRSEVSTQPNPATSGKSSRDELFGHRVRISK